MLTEVFTWVHCEFESFIFLKLLNPDYFLPCEWKLEYGSLTALRFSLKFSLVCIFNSSLSAWKAISQLSSV